MLYIYNSDMFTCAGCKRNWSTRATKHYFCIISERLITNRYRVSILIISRFSFRKMLETKRSLILRRSTTRVFKGYNKQAFTDSMGLACRVLIYLISLTNYHTLVLSVEKGVELIQKLTVISTGLILKIFWANEPIFSLKGRVLKAFLSWFW